MPCLFQTRNAGLIHQKNELNNAHTLAGQGPLFRSWLKNSPDETKEWFWPECGFQNERTVWIYLAALRKTDAAGAFGFESIGHDFWAKVKFPEIQPQEYVPLPDLNGINFGDGFVLVVDEWESVDQYERFIGELQAEGVFADAGAQGEPEVTIAEAITTADQY